MGGGGFDFFGGVSAFFQRIFDAFQAFILDVINFILRVLSIVVAVLRAVIVFLGKAFEAVFRGVKHVISDIVHGRFLHLWEDYLKLKAKIKAWFDKHLRWLLELRRRFDEWFNRTIKPILNFLQRIRGVLAIFRVFHLKFAEKLDALIGRLESKIIRNVLVLRQKVNEISTIINLILDPALVIRENVLLQSIAARLRQLRALLGLPDARALTGAEQKTLDRERTRYLASTVDGHIAQLVQSGPTPEDQAESALARAALEEMVGAKVP